MFQSPARQWWGRRFRLPGPLAIFALAGLLQAQGPATFTSDVNLVRVTATVKNPAGELVGALQQSDFTVLDNGVRQEIAVFERKTEVPLSVILLVDTSGSTAKDLKYETDSAAKFLHALLSEGNLEDAVALYSFNYDVRMERDFTHNFASLENRLKLLHGEAGTSIYDALFYTSQALQRRQGRKVIVVVTDGQNTTSSKDIQAALREAQYADAIVFPVVVIPITNDAGRSIGGEHALEFIAKGTGGRTFYPSVGKELDKVFSDIITELRTQYLLGFYPHNVPLTKSPFHTLTVTVKQPDLRVSARNGYYGEAVGATTPNARTSVAPDVKKRLPEQ